MLLWTTLTADSFDCTHFLECYIVVVSPTPHPTDTKQSPHYRGERKCRAKKIHNHVYTTVSPTVEELRNWFLWFYYTNSLLYELIYSFVLKIVEPCYPHIIYTYYTLVPNAFPCPIWLMSFSWEICFYNYMVNEP